MDIQTVESSRCEFKEGVQKCDNIYILIKLNNINNYFIAKLLSTNTDRRQLKVCCLYPPFCLINRKSRLCKKIKTDNNDSLPSTFYIYEKEIENIEFITDSDISSLKQKLFNHLEFTLREKEF
eukprot:UN05404